MKQKISERLEIPSGTECNINNGILTCSKSGASVTRKVALKKINVKVEGNAIVFECEAGNKNQLKQIMSLVAHAKNMFFGVSEKYTYKLEACNVHFPMTLKIEGNRMVINNFLGEKTPRYASIIPGADVQIKGTIITVAANSKEIAGQTAANIEKATIVRKRDRRVFQDGIYITEKAGRAI